MSIVSIAVGNAYPKFNHYIATVSFVSLRGPNMHERLTRKKNDRQAKKSEEEGYGR